MSKIPEGTEGFFGMNFYRNVVEGEGYQFWHSSSYWQDSKWPPLGVIRPIAEHPDYVAPARAWDGQGLPPVGTVCEFLTGHEWLQGEVIAHYRSDAILAYDCQFDGDSGYQIYDAMPSELRPIRTPEQIEREARSALLKDMMNTGGLVIEQAEELYDAGYRKVEPK